MTETAAPLTANKPVAKTNVREQDKIPFYTTPELLMEYNKFVDMKFQEKGKDAEKVNGYEVYFKPSIIFPEFNPRGPHVETLTEVLDVDEHGKLRMDEHGNPKTIPNVYSYRVVYTVEKGYTRPGVNGSTPVFESLGTQRMLAALFLKKFEEYSS